MKILLVTSSFKGGGITSYALELINNYCNGNELSVIVGDEGKFTLDRNLLKVYNCETSNLSISNAEKLINLINDIIKPEVIINSFAPLMSLVSPYISNDCRIINVSHSLRYAEADTAGFNSQYVDNIIALSYYNKEYIDKTFNIKINDKVKVVYNFVQDDKRAFEIKEEKKNNLPLNIVYAGGTTPPKSPELICLILDKLLKTKYNFKFIFMGTKTPPLKKIQPFKSVEQLFTSDDRLVFTGRIPRDEAEKVISSANIFLIPSRREGCPMAMLEAMRYGTIIITSDYKNACREMIEHGKNGFMIPHNEIDKVVNLITDIIQNHSKYNDIYDACIKNFNDNFSLKKWASQMDELVKCGVNNHIKRLENFDVKSYSKSCAKYKRRMKYNFYHVLFFETLKSAVPFALRYLKK